MTGYEGAADGIGFYNKTMDGPGLNPPHYSRPYHQFLFKSVWG